MTYTFSFPKPAKLMSLNDREHWAIKATFARAWRRSAWAYSKQSINKSLSHAVVFVSLPVASLKTRRDPHNFIATIKPIIDGMVDAGLWPDDTAEWVEVREPQFHIGKDVVIIINTDGPI